MFFGSELLFFWGGTAAKRLSTPKVSPSIRARKEPYQYKIIRLLFAIGVRLLSHHTPCVMVRISDPQHSEEEAILKQVYSVFAVSYSKSEDILLDGGGYLFLK